MTSAEASSHPIDPTQGVTAGTPSRVQALGAASFAALLGLTLLWGVGFSHIDAVHNAAHDTRHSAGFPCH